MRQKCISTGQGFQGTHCEMARYVRILSILLLAVFAVGTVVHAANVASMNMQMAFAAIDGGDIGGCQDCPDGGDDMQLCDDVCVSPISAVMPFGQAGLPEVAATIERSVSRSMSGRTGLPNPYPPRFITLS